MSWITLKIIDEKRKEVEPEELTDTGLGIIINDCKNLIEKLEDLYNKKQEEK